MRLLVVVVVVVVVGSSLFLHKTTTHLHSASFWPKLELQIQFNSRVMNQESSKWPSHANERSIRWKMLPVQLQTMTNRLIQSSQILASAQLARIQCFRPRCGYATIFPRLTMLNQVAKWSREVVVKIQKERIEDMEELGVQRACEI